MKRFTETTKWDDPWYIDLSAEAKTLWEYLRDKCDNAGVIDLSHRQANFLLNGQTTSEDLLKELGDRVTTLESGKILIKDFVDFQYGQLSEASNLHKNVIKILRKHNLYDEETKGILTLEKGFRKRPSKGKGKGSGIGNGKVKVNLKEIILDFVHSGVEENKIFLPFDSEEFLSAFILWVKYRNEIGKKVHDGAISLQGQLRKIQTVSKDNEQKAIDIINNCINNKWVGIQDHNTINNGTGQPTSDQDIFDTVQKQSEDYGE